MTHNLAPALKGRATSGFAGQSPSGAKDWKDWPAPAFPQPRRGFHSRVARPFKAGVIYALVRFTVALLMGDLSVTTQPVRAQPLLFTGTNLSGGEFGDVHPGKAPVYGKDFVYPNEGESAYFASKGMNVIRLPFRWEVLQPTPKTPLVLAEEQRLRDVVAAATKKNLVVLLDPHNYARYYGKVIGGPDVSDADFADFWGRLAGDFRGNPRVWFGLMNEPHDMPTPQWFDAANAAVAAIRKAGAKNLILVPGNGWSGAHSWVESGNDLLLKIVDPAHHYAFEAHQYLDADNSGSHPEVVSATVGSERLRAFTDWCRRHHQRAFLGEFGTAASDTGRQAIGDMLTMMEKNRDVWIGYTWWSAGPWWGNYMFTIEPDKGADRPQMGYLQPHLQVSPKAVRSRATGTKASR